MLTACASQLRYTTMSISGVGTVTQPVGLDFNAAFAMGQAVEADLALLARVLPSVESAILAPSEDGEFDDFADAAVSSEP